SITVSTASMSVTNIGATTLTINSGGSVAIVPGSSNASKVSALTIAGGVNPTGTLDLGTGGIVVDYTGTSPFATLKSQIQHAFAGANWNASGITSSSAASIAANSSNFHKTAIGFAEASALGVNSFMNLSVDTTAVLMRYAFVG